MAVKTCKECNEKITEGHIVCVEFEEVYFCSDCFGKLYTEEEMKRMYEDGEQFFTEFWE